MDSLWTLTQQHQSNQNMHKWRYGNSIYNNSMHDQMDNNVTSFEYNGKTYYEYDDDAQVQQHQYEEIKDDNTLNEHTRIIQRNVILVTGLSSKLCDKHLLKSNKWFGKYGDIKQIYIDYWNKWVFIMYLYRESATNAINEMNHYRLRNGKQLIVNHGINKYCKYFLNFKKCPYKNCVNVHHVANMDDLILNQNDTEHSHKNNINNYPYHNNPNFSLNEYQNQQQNEYFSNSESSSSSAENITNSEQNQLDILQSKLDALQHENEKLKQTNAVLKAKAGKDSKDSKNTEISRLKQENVKKSQIISRLNKNMKNLQNDYLAEIEELEQKLQQTQSQLKPPKLVKYNSEYYENIQLKNDLRFQQIQYGLLQSSYYRVIYELESVKDHKKNKYQKYKTKFARLQNKYSKLKEKAGYKSWDWLDCYEWIKGHGKDIGDFTNKQYEGYGMNTHDGWRYSDANPNFRNGTFPYIHQFDLKHLDKTVQQEVVFEMELDMTQKESENAILRFTYYHKPKSGVNRIRTDGEYSNIRFDNIDINQEYRLAVDVGTSSRTVKSVELLSE